MKFAPGAHGVLRVLVLGKAISSGLFGFCWLGAVSVGVGLIDDVAILKLPVLRKGIVKFFLGESFIDIADIEAGI